MRQLLLTSALITPLLAGSVFAQDATVPEPEVQEQGQTTEGAAGEATEDPLIVEETEVEPAADTAEGAADPAADMAQEGEAVEVETAPETAQEGEAMEPAPDMAEEGDVATEEVEVETVESTEPAPESILREQASNELRVDWITGTTIMSPEGEAIGNVQDLIVDGETGQVSAAIVGVGGFLGIGAKQIAVDFAEMQIDYDAQEISMDLTREEAEAAPEYAFREQESAPAPEPAMDPAMDTGTGLAPAPAPAPAPAD